MNELAVVIDGRSPLAVFHRLSMWTQIEYEEGQGHPVLLCSAVDLSTPPFLRATVLALQEGEGIPEGSRDAWIPVHHVLAVFELRKGDPKPLGFV